MKGRKEVVPLSLLTEEKQLDRARIGAQAAHAVDPAVNRMQLLAEFASLPDPLFSRCLTD